MPPQDQPHLREGSEGPIEHATRGISEFRERAQAYAERLSGDVDGMSTIEASAPPESQEDTLEAMKIYLSDIFRRLEKKGANMSRLANDPESVFRMVQVFNIYEPDEQADENQVAGQRCAISTARRLMKEKGPTGDLLRSKAFWNGVYNNATALTSKAWDTVAEHFEKHKKMAMLIGGAVFLFGVIRGIRSVRKIRRGEEVKSVHKFWKFALLMAGVGFVFKDQFTDFFKSQTMNSEYPILDENIANMKALVNGTVAFLNPATWKKLMGCAWGRKWIKECELDLGRSIAPGQPKKTFEKREINTKNLDKPDGSKTVCIGDSIMNGMRNPERGWKPSPRFVGADRMTTSQVLTLLRNDPAARQQLQGMDEALIYGGGNNAGDPKQAAKDFIEMAKICRESGIKKVVISTRFPIDPRYKKQKGDTWFKRRHQWSMAMRAEVLRAYKAGEFPGGTQIADLFMQFNNGNDEMDPQFVQGEDDEHNHTHPKATYVAALNHMRSGGTYQSPSQMLSEEAEIVRPGILAKHSDLVFISASVGKGMSHKLGKNVGFVGEGGLGSGDIRKKVEQDKKELLGRKMAVIHAGGNDVVYGKYENILGNLEAIIETCKDAGIPKIVLLTRFPYEKKYGINGVTKNMVVLRQKIIEKFGKDPRVQVVDLFGRFANAEGRLPSKYDNKPRRNNKGEWVCDRLHPFKAYKDGLRYISEQTQEPLITQWVGGENRVA